MWAAWQAASAMAQKKDATRSDYVQPLSTECGEEPDSVAQNVNV